MQPPPDRIDTLTLFSEQCAVLLQQALERDEKARADGKTIHHGSSPTQPNKKDDDDSEESNSDDYFKEEDSNSSSEEEEEEEEVQEKHQKEQDQQPQSSSSTDHTTKQNNNKPKAKPSQKPKPTMTQQQQQFAVKKHVDNVTCQILPVNDTEALHVSTSLLSKQQDISIAERHYDASQKSPSRELLQLSQTLQEKPVMVLLLRSGRFAAGIFNGSKCIVHRACQRYTIRKGQGKAQSAQDGNRRPKSMGAQLRRAGEEQLQQDIYETLQDWKPHIQQSALVLFSCPKAMNKYLFDAIDDDSVLTKQDPRIRRLPLDLGRPTYESVCIAHQVMTTVTLRVYSEQPSVVAVEETQLGQQIQQQQQLCNKNEKQAETKPEKKPDIVIPLTPLHEACQKGDVDTIAKMLSNLQQEYAVPTPPHNEDNSHPDIPTTVMMTVGKMINLRVGPDFKTCLHYSAESSSSVDPATTADCITQLLMQGKAKPGIVDARQRPPYFLASHDRIRDAFRIARASLGEDYCRWDDDAKVGPPLTEEDIAARKQKEAEKKRKKKARQKQKKAQEKEEEEEERRQKEEAEVKRKQVEDAKRVRDGLQPKAKATGGTVCDFCQTVVKGRKRKDMFSRLDYVYCSAECVQKHKRELMAAAAMARFG